MKDTFVPVTLSFGDASVRLGHVEQDIQEQVATAFRGFLVRGQNDYGFPRNGFVFEGDWSDPLSIPFELVLLGIIRRLAEKREDDAGHA